MTLFGHPLGDTARLEPLEPWQAGEFAEYVERVRPHLAPWLPWAHAVTDTASARAWLQRYAEEQAQGRGRVCAIRVAGELAGGALFRVFDTATRVCELGAWIAPEAEGSGLVTRACAHLVEWAVAERGIARVEWRVTPANTRSIAVAKRLGMRYEGTLREVFPMNGKRQDLEVWALLAGELTGRRDGE